MSIVSCVWRSGRMSVYVRRLPRQVTTPAKPHERDRSPQGGEHALVVVTTGEMFSSLKAQCSIFTGMGVFG